MIANASSGISPQEALNEAGFGDLDATDFGDLLVHYSDAAPTVEAEALAPIVARASQVPFTEDDLTDLALDTNSEAADAFSMFEAVSAGLDIDYGETEVDAISADEHAVDQLSTGPADDDQPLDDVDFGDGLDDQTLLDLGDEVAAAADDFDPATAELEVDFVTVGEAVADTDPADVFGESIEVVELEQVDEPAEAEEDFDIDLDG